MIKTVITEVGLTWDSSAEEEFGALLKDIDFEQEIVNWSQSTTVTDAYTSKGFDVKVSFLKLFSEEFL